MGFSATWALASTAERQQAATAYVGGEVGIAPARWRIPGSASWFGWLTTPTGCGWLYSPVN
jgi:hypothetical protein